MVGNMSPNWCLTPILLSALITFAVLLACEYRDEPEERTKIEPTDSVADPKINDGMSPQREADLMRKAISGDWMAARELAQFRYFVLQKFDTTTLWLSRVWAKSDSGGHSMIAHLLSKSCKRSDRVTAVEHYEMFFSSYPPPRPPGLYDELNDVKVAVDRPQEKCIVY
ncbi:MAG: hypothetical protein ABL973_10015 [Micropepsaceae bacterium]